MRLNWWNLNTLGVSSVLFCAPISHEGVLIGKSIESSIVCEGLIIGISSIKSIMCEGLVITTSIDSTIGNVTSIPGLLFYHRNAELTFLVLSLACFFSAFLVVIFLFGVVKDSGYVININFTLIYNWFWSITPVNLVCYLQTLEKKLWRDLKHAPHYSEHCEAQEADHCRSRQAQEANHCRSRYAWRENSRNVCLHSTNQTKALLPTAGPSVLIVPLESERKDTSLASMVYRGRVG